MTNILARLPQQSSCSALLGAEGAAAGAYFRGIACILPNSLGFQGRNLRPPKDPFNAVLSLCYTLLYAEAQLVIHAAGYDPYWGVLHKMAFGRASFACDVMEPIRPMVDRFAIDAFRNHILRAEDFSTSQTLVCWAKPDDPGSTQHGRSSWTSAARQYAKSLAVGRGLVFPDLLNRVKVGHDNHSYKEFCHGFAPPPLSQRIQINAVHLVQVEGRRACDVADELGIGRQTLYSWLHEARTGVLSGTSETPAKSLLRRPKLPD